MSTLTLLALFISSLGLIALASYNTERRAKEIGIRKVLGATVQSIMIMLSKDFIKLVVIAIFIAVPAAWYTINKWLEGFAYRIQLSWWMFFIAGLVVILIALTTISYQSIKTALMDPVKSLRSE
jgi:putative ABC transport system permease protein